MNKKISTTLLILLFAFVAKAQVKIMNSTVSLNDKMQPCITAIYDFDEDALEKALEFKMEEEFKTSSSKKYKDGFRLYKEVLLPNISKEKIDLYYKIEGSKKNSTLNCVVSKGYDNFIVENVDTAIWNNVKMLLNDITLTHKKLEHLQAIDEQKKITEKASKKYISVVDDGKDLQKDLEKLNKKIADNKEEQEKLNKLMNEEKSKLSELEKVKL